jgi:uncharacterized membrane protein
MPGEEKQASPQPSKSQQAPQTQSGTGLPANVAAALSYVLGAFTGIVFYLIEKDRFVRFHALQSIILTVAWFVAWIIVTVLTAVLAVIPVLGWLIGLLLWVVVAFGGIGVWLYLIVKAYQGASPRLPYLADMADKYVTAVP